MKNYRLLFVFLLCLSCACTVLLGIMTPAIADDCGTSGTAGNCDTCISSAIYKTELSGEEIIGSAFATINDVLKDVEKDFFDGIINAHGFQAMIGTGILLYIGLYGLMIMFNISSYRVNEITSRLIKIAIVYTMTSVTAWQSFNVWIAQPVIFGMNDIIREFTEAAEGGGSSIAHMQFANGSSGFGSSGVALDSQAFTNMFGSSITAVFSIQLYTAIIAVAGTGFFGWIISLFLIWALVEFGMMMIGAIVTYAKAIIGLAFLFGIAPLFFIFLLFDRTRPIFFGWLSQVISFALQPVMLFAFLSFYVALITESVKHLLLAPGTGNQPVDFCWTKWFSVPGALWDMGMWRPTHDGGVQTQHWYDSKTGQALPEPMRVSNILYFLMICHLGRTFSKFIETISTDLAGGTGPGMMRGGDVANLAQKGFKAISPNKESKTV